MWQRLQAQVPLALSKLLSMLMGKWPTSSPFMKHTTKQLWSFISSHLTCMLKNLTNNRGQWSLVIYGDLTQHSSANTTSLSTMIQIYCGLQHTVTKCTVSDDHMHPLTRLYVAAPDRNQISFRHVFRVYHQVWCTIALSWGRGSYATCKHMNIWCMYWSVYEPRP